MNPQARELGDRVVAFANELIDPMLCRQPAYGAPGFAHCAACCYGTGIIITCREEQAIADAADALHKAASVLYDSALSDAPTSDESSTLVPKSSPGNSGNRP